MKRGRRSFKKMSVMRLCLVYLAMIWSCCEAYKILVVFPMPSRSHGNLGDGIVRNLLKEGHEVTYISPYTYKPASPNLRVIDGSPEEDAMRHDGLSVEAIMQKRINLQDHGPLMFMMNAIMKSAVQNNNIKKLLNDPSEKFDVVIVEWMFTKLLAGFAAVFNCPLIWVSSMDVHWTILKLIDQPSNPAYTVDILSSITPPLTFTQRVTELYNQLKVQFVEYMYFDDVERQAYEEVFAPYVTKRGRQPPSFYDIQYNASLVLANSHVSLGEAVPLPQNYIAVGGYHIDEDVKPLPQDLKEIMDNAKNGVIYFSMGSNLKSKDIPKEIKDGILKMFGELKQTVLWKFEEDLPNVPKNVHILKWAPQPSILSHPNIVLFITHGGLLSTTETIHFGVPVIGIPIFGDQFINVIRSVQRGFALQVDLSFTMVNELKAAIEEVITNPRYAEKVKELSFIYHNRPITPGKEVAHWVKYVIETRGAPHLRSPALNVPFYQKLYLDLLAVILVILILIVIVIKRVCCLFCSKKSVTSSKKKSN